MKRIGNFPEDEGDIVMPEESSAEKTLMVEPPGQVRTVIPEHLILSRLVRSEEMREFFIQMWIQNPELARQVPAKVQRLLLALGALETKRGDCSC